MLKLKSEQEFYRELGRYLRRLRKKKGLSPFYFGRRLGVHAMIYYEMECGRIPPTPYHVYRVIHMCAPELLRGIV